MKDKTFDNRGIGLITAIFIIVVVASFGLLLSRFVITHSTASAEDYLWAQALYSADSIIKLRLLQEDNASLAVTDSSIMGYTTTQTPDPLTALSNPGVLEVVAEQGLVSRTVQVNYTLTIN